MNGIVWCDEPGEDDDVTDDPRDATCADCLKRAAAYGVAAAMRYAAVEAGATRDPELVRERDEAIRRVSAIGAALEGHSAFFCHGCESLFRLDERKLHAGGLAWCVRCAPGARVLS